MKKQLLMKTLLVAAGLLMGANAWADGNKRTLSAQDYETAKSPDWVTNNDKVSISLVSGDATYGKYVIIDMGSEAANRGAYKTITPSFEYGSGYTTAGMTVSGYNVEFDMLIQSGNTSNRSESQFVVTTASYTKTDGLSLYSGDYVFALSQPKRTASGVDTKWYVNDLTYSDEDKAVTLSNTVWYHVKLVITASSVNYTIINNSTSETVKSGSKTVATLPSLNEFFTVVGRGYGKTQFDNLEIYDYVDAETITAPTIAVAYAGANRTVTISSGTSSMSNTVKTYYTLDGTNPTSTSTEYTKALTITEDCTVKAVTISSTDAASSVSSLAVTVGKIALATPTITASGFSNTTGVYVTNPTFDFACNNATVDGNPTATLSYTFTPEGGSESAVTPGTSFTPTTKGTLKVIASHKDYNSSEKTLVVSNRYSISYTGRDYSTATTSDISTSEGTWGTPYTVKWDGWKAGLTATQRIKDMSDDYRFRISNTTTCAFVNGWGWVREDQSKSYNYQSRYAKEGYFVGLKVNTSKGNDATQLTYKTVYCSSGSGDVTNTVTISVDAGHLVQQLYFYEAANVSDVDLAIADCKVYDTSAAFATAIAAETFSTAAEVYAFNTTYHITNGAFTDGIRNITGVIRNAAVADATDWDGAVILNGQKYTGAPDDYYLDKNTETIDASQTIYGLPAGVYILKAATRASAETDGNIYVYDGTNTSRTDINANGNTGGELGNGWDWTEVKFTLTATANVKVGFYADVNATGKWASCDDFHLSRVESVSATIGSTGWTTFSSNYSLDLSKMTPSSGTVTAYYASTVGAKSVTLTSTDKSNLAAGQGIMLKGTAGATITIPVVASGEAISGNKLVGCANGTTLDANANLYVLVKNGSTPEFQSLTENGATIPAGKAYLNAGIINARSLQIVFDETTGVEAMHNAQCTMHNEMYDLQGRRVSQPKKGLYIKNGQKVYIK